MTNPARIAVGISAIGFVAAIGIYTLIRGDFDPAPSAPAKNAVSWSIAPPIGDGSAEEESASPDSLAKASSSQYRPMDFGAKYHGFVVGQRASLADALTGALEGTPEGLEALQRYFDAALGDEEALRHLAGRLLDALGESAIRNDYDAMSKATERVGEAVAQAMAAGYTASYQFLDNYKLPRTAHGWDFGDDAKKAPGDFIRIGVKSREVKGNHLRVFDLPGGAPLFGDGLEDVERFATDLPDGLYRIYILSAKRANGALPRHPFGDSVRTNGRSVRLIETRQSFPEAQVRFTAGGIELDLPAAATAAEEIAPTTIRYNAAKSAQGLLVMTQALVANGAFTVEFDVPEGSETYLVGLIAEESDYSAIEKDLELQIAALLAGTETAAGQPAAPPKISPFKVAFVAPAASSNPGRGGPSASSSGGSGSGGYSPGGGGSSTSSGGSSGSGSSGGISPASSGGNTSSGSGPGGATSTSGGSSTSTSGGDGSSGSSTSSGGSSTSGGDGSSGSSTSSGGSSTSGGDGSSGSTTSSGGSSTSGGDGSSGASTSSGGSSTSGGGSSGSSTSSGGSSTSTSGGSSTSTSGGDGSSSSSTSGGSSTSSGGSSTSGGDGSSGSSTSSGGSSTSGGDGSSGSSTSSGGSSTSTSGGSSTSTSGGDGSSGSSTSSGSSSTSGGDGSSGSSTSSGGSSTSGGDGSSGASTSSGGSSTSGGDGSSGSSTSSGGSSTSGGDGSSSSSTSGGSSTSSGGFSTSTSGGSGTSTSGGDGSSGSSTSSGGSSTSTSGGSSTSTSGGDGSSSSSTSSGGSSTSTSGGDGSSGSSTSTGGTLISTSGGDGSSGSSTSGSSSTSTSGGGDPTLLAEAGPDQWGDLGASFLFNGCESLFSDALICDFSESYLQDHFMAAWYLGDQQIGNGFSITLDTGAGTLFDSPQSYLLTFEIIFLDGGSPILTSSDQARLALARRNISEPAILLIFVASILGLGYLRWRRWWA